MTVPFALAIASLFAADADWPQFRGPAGQGIAESKSMPTKIGPSENVAWKQTIPGSGWSSPIVAGGRIYVTTAVSEGEGKQSDYTLRLLAIDARDGKIVWNKEVFRQEAKAAPRIHSKNSHASPTPVFADGKIYVHFGHQGTACVDANGEIVWSTRKYVYPPVHGGGSCPVVVGDLLILTCDGGSKPFRFALNRKTGEEVWRKDRETNAKKTFSFSTPLLIQSDGRDVLVSPGSDVVSGIDPRTGDEIWRVKYTGYSVVPRPAYADGVLYVSTSFDSPKLIAFRPTGSGELTKEQILWTCDQAAPCTPSMLLLGGNLFMCSDRGVVSCLDAKTGDRKWQQRLLGPTSASPVEAGGVVCWFDEAGKGVFFNAGPKLEVVAKCDLKERVFASPAVVDGRLIVRTESKLYCFGTQTATAVARKE